VGEGVGVWLGVAVAAGGEEAVGAGETVGDGRRAWLGVALALGGVVGNTVRLGGSALAAWVTRAVAEASGDSDGGF
jgi:hypothetical protein